jgi:hypothetical protein
MPVVPVGVFPTTRWLAVDVLLRVATAMEGGDAGAAMATEVSNILHRANAEGNAA